MELSQLHLQLTLLAPGPLGKDVQNDLCPVDDLGPQPVLEAALLDRGQDVIEDHHVRLQIPEQCS